MTVIVQRVLHMFTATREQPRPERARQPQIRARGTAAEGQSKC